MALILPRRSSSRRARVGLVAAMLLVVAAAGARSSDARAANHGTIDLRFTDALAEVTRAGDALRVHYAGMTAPSGALELPESVRWIELPPGMAVTSVEVESVETVMLPAAPGADAGASLARTPDDRRPDVPHAGDVRSVADEALDVMPATVWAALGAQGSMRGHRIAAIRVRPVRIDPLSGQLELARHLRLRYTIAPATTDQVLPRHRVVPAIERRFDRALDRLLVTAPGDDRLPPAGETARDGGVAGPGPFQPTFRPTTDGSAVEYVIVTSDVLAPEFERLADWKTHKGVQTVVRTVEWIDATYPNGADRAERIRFFIRDAYQNWGTLFVLLGGDSDVVPARYGETTFYGGESIPADLYYGCLEGNWNADGDDRFGEGISEFDPGDDVDLFFEVAIGRAPVSTPAEAGMFIDKTLLYEVDAPGEARYPTSMLVLAEHLYGDTHGAEIAEDAIALLPPWFQVTRLYEFAASYPGSIELTDEAAIDSINAGYGIVHHVGHGYRNTMSVGEGILTNADADNLTNAPRNSIVFAINCSSASFDFNTIGERWLKNPDGGATAYLGTSRLAFASASNLYQNAWYEHVFVDSVGAIGLATEMARTALTLNSQYDGSTRWNLMATTLLGDPELDVYRHPIAPVAVSHPASLELGGGPVTVGVTTAGTPLPGATVTLTMDDGSAWVRVETGAAGQAILDFRPAGEGTATLAVHRGSYRAYQTALAVESVSGPYLSVLDWSVDDDMVGGSSGDGDGQADAGETIELGVTLRNTGSSAANNLSAVLTADDPLGMLTVTDDTVSYGTISTGGASVGFGSFTIEIDAGAPTAYQPILTLSISGNQGSWTDTLPLPLRRPFVEHVGHAIDDDLPRGDGDGLIEAGETIRYTLALRNSGQHVARQVTAELRVLRASDGVPHPQVTVSDDQAAFGDLDEATVASGDRFEFSLGSSVAPDDILLEISLADAHGPLSTELVDVIPPTAVEADSIQGFGSTSIVTLRWRPSASPDVRGYDVWRAPVPGGPFARLNTHLVDGSSVYEDAGLPDLTRFYYYVVARDSSMNHSPISGVVSASTNPPLSPGWPIELGQQADSSPNVANIDEGPYFEVFTASDMVYGWHGNATEIVDGDGDDRTSGPFSLRGFDADRGFGATTALGDFEQDGDLEIVNVGWGIDSLFVWDDGGAMVPGFPKRVMDDFNWASPVLADIDVDGNLEIIHWAGGGGRLFAWHHDGTEVVDGDQNPATDGIMARIFGISFSYSSPVVCDLDGDVWMEIVVAANLSTDNSGGVYAFNHNGTPVPGWPFFTGSAGHPSQVSASLAAADFDRDGRDEIVVSCERDGGTLYVLTGDGVTYPGWPVSSPAVTSVARLPSPVVADVDDDGEFDIILPGTDGRLRIWDSAGNLYPGFPVVYMEDVSINASQSTPSVGDVDGDGEVEILFGDEAGLVHGYNPDGTLVSGFPIRTYGEVRTTPAIWDLDSDNLVEVIVVGYDSNVYVWDLPFDFNPSLTPWPFFRHDTRNTGLVTSDILPDAVGDAGAPPRLVTLYPVAPNPMRAHSRIVFELPVAGGQARPVVLSVYDPLGRLVRRLHDGPLEGGRHVLEWDGRTAAGDGAASGIYFLRLESQGSTLTRKVTVLR